MNPNLDTNFKFVLKFKCYTQNSVQKQYLLLNLPAEIHTMPTIVSSLTEIIFILQSLVAQC